MRDYLFKVKGIPYFMRWSQWFDNLGDYNERLDSINLKEATYKTKKGFRPSVIVALSFGNSRDKYSYNFRLAKILKDAVSITKCRKVILEEAVYQIFCKNFNQSKLKMFKFGEHAEDSLLNSSINTREGLILTKKIIKKNKFNSKKILFIAHPAHIFRVLEIAKKLGLNGESFIEKKGFYPKKDGQIFARWKTTFVLREILVRIHHKILGWI